MDNGKIKDRVIHQKWLVIFITACNMWFANADQSPVGVFMGFGLKNYPNGLENRRAFGDSLLLLVSLNKAREIVKKGFKRGSPLPPSHFIIKELCWSLGVGRAFE